MHSKKKSLFAYGLLILFVYSGTRIAVTLSKSGLPTKDSELTTLEPASQKNEWLLNTE